MPVVNLEKVGKELVTMSEDMLMHEGELHRDISFEQMGLDEVTLESQFAVQSQIPLIADPATQTQASRVSELVDRYATHVTLNELGKRLLVASKAGDAEEVRTLMGKGAPFTCDWLGTSALHLAAMYNNIEVCEILLRAGISRDSRTKVDKTALHLAATEGHAIVTQMLLHHGADVNAVDMLHMTPLHWAVDRANREVIRILLESGANPNIQSKFNKSVYSIANDKRRTDLIEFIESIKPADDVALLHGMDREMEEATLAATNSLTNEMAQVPAVCQQEEVETSATGKYDTNKFFASEDYLATKELLLQHDVPSEAPPTVTKESLPSTNEEDLVPTNQTMQYLQAHGITLLPLEEESSLTEVAMESGGRVVLTEAGKLAMTLTNEEIPKITRTNRTKITKRKQYISRHVSSTTNEMNDPKTRYHLDITDTVEDHNPLPNKKRPAESGNSVAYQFQVREATLKAEQAEKLAIEAQQYSEEWRQKAEMLTEQLGKTLRQNEHYKMLIENLKRKRVHD